MVWDNSLRFTLLTLLVWMPGFLYGHLGVADGFAFELGHHLLSLL